MSERADALWVPEQSLVPLGERVYVYRAVGGKAALAEVQAGLRTPGEVEIKAGLTQKGRGRDRRPDPGPVTARPTPLSRGYRRPVTRTS